MENFGMLRRYFLVILFSGILFTSCEKNNNDSEDPQKDFTNEEVSEWIYEWMNTLYLWNDEIPQGLNPASESDPIAFYRKLLFREEDKWSYITDDFEKFYAELSGTPTSMGYSPAFGRITSTDRVFIAIEYVIPETPASEAGLKRGDIIIAIDGTELNTSNYYELYSQDSYTADLGVYDPISNSVEDANKSVSLTARVITSKPVIHHEVIDYQDKKIGYLVYVDFVSGISNMFVGELDNAIADLVSAGIDELIVDFRYNPGGEIKMASYLASSIAPLNLSVFSNVLVTYVYNDYLNQVFMENGGPDSRDLNLYFSGSDFNLNMEKIYFMTSSGTASASELVITGLEPYIDVVVVGDTTYGKYTGAWVWPDTETPARHNYAIVPIVLKYANSEGVTEFKNGLLPDYPINDWVPGAGEFGSFSDPMLAKTLEVITGVNPMPVSKKAGLYHNYEIIPDHRKIDRKSINPDILDPGFIHEQN
jgi:C-terminal processing protease CtpA/Prc